jgi:hypothetical protein
MQTWLDEQAVWVLRDNGKHTRVVGNAVSVVAIGDAARPSGELNARSVAGREVVMYSTWDGFDASSIFALESNTGLILSQWIRGREFQVLPIVSLDRCVPGTPPPGDPILTLISTCKSDSPLATTPATEAAKARKDAQSGAAASKRCFIRDRDSPLPSSAVAEAHIDTVHDAAERPVPFISPRDTRVCDTVQCPASTRNLPESPALVGMVPPNGAPAVHRGVGSLAGLIMSHTSRVEQRALSGGRSATAPRRCGNLEANSPFMYRGERARVLPGCTFPVCCEECDIHARYRWRMHRDFHSRVHACVQQLAHNFPVVLST